MTSVDDDVSANRAAALYAALRVEYPTVSEVKIAQVILEAGDGVDLFGLTGPERYARVEIIARNQLALHLAEHETRRSAQLNGHQRRTAPQKTEDEDPSL